jgi:DNA-binding transcriptional LysR family regulator
MEISYLKEFTVLANTCNFLEAAESLFISQSTLSRHIKIMEMELGVTLFNRTTRKTELSRAGRILLNYAEQISNLQTEYSLALLNSFEGAQKTITVGSTPSMSYYNTTEMLAKFQSENSNFKISIIEGDSNWLKEMLRQGKCDCAFIREIDDLDQEFGKIQFATDILVAVLPLDHPLSNHESISLAQLSNESFLLLPENTLMHNLCVSNCRNAGFEPKVIFTDSKGVGVSLLMKCPAMSIRHHNTAIVDIEPTIKTNICLMYRKSGEKSVSATHFLRYVKQK